MGDFGPVKPHVAEVANATNFAGKNFRNASNPDTTPNYTLLDDLVLNWKVMAWVPGNISLLNHLHFCRSWRGQREAKFEPFAMHGLRTAKTIYYPLWTIPAHATRIGLIWDLMSLWWAVFTEFHVTYDHEAIFTYQGIKTALSSLLALGASIVILTWFNGTQEGVPSTRQCLHLLIVLVWVSKPILFLPPTPSRGQLEASSDGVPLPKKASIKIQNLPEYSSRASAWTSRVLASVLGFLQKHKQGDFPRFLSMETEKLDFLVLRPQAR